MTPSAAGALLLAACRAGRYNRAMSATPDDLFAFLANLGITAVTTTHPPLFTVAESRALRGLIPGGHTKNLFLKDRKGRLFLVVALEDAAIDLKALPAAVGASGKFSFASAELLKQHLGVEPGSVTPFGAFNDREGAVTIVLDAAMLENERLNFHPLINTMTSTIGRDDLVAFLRATGHEPLVVAASRPEPAGGMRPDDCQTRIAAPS